MEQPFYPPEPPLIISSVSGEFSVPRRIDGRNPADIAYPRVHVPPGSSLYDDTARCSGLSTICAVMVLPTMPRVEMFAVAVGGEPHGLRDPVLRESFQHKVHFGRHKTIAKNTGGRMGLALPDPCR